jgi:tetratricopeptide (TPR) repeat protein
MDCAPAALAMQSRAPGQRVPSNRIFYVKLLRREAAAKVELGGTRNPAAFNAYLWGAKEFVSRHELENLPAAIAAYTEAIHLDPHYALAIASRSIVLSYGAAEAATPAASREGFGRAEADAQKAIALAPDLAQAHLALATVLELGTYRR